MTSPARGLRGVWLGRRPYLPVLALQERLRDARMAGRIEDVVLLLEHEPVVTLGRRADAGNVLLGKDALAARRIDLVETGRGGDVTLHAPGQLVGYPILDLNPDRCDVRRYVKDLTEVMRRLCLRHGVAGGAVPGKIGLWVDRGTPGDFPGDAADRDIAKIGAIGVALSRWVTMHGFALNLTLPVELFSLIVPCGIREHGVTTLLEVTGNAPDIRAEARAACSILGSVFARSEVAFEDAEGRPLGEIFPGTAADGPATTVPG